MGLRFEGDQVLSVRSCVFAEFSSTFRAQSICQMVSYTYSEMGSTERELVTLFRTKTVDPDSQPELARTLLESRTKVSSETGYMMKFGERSHRAFTVFDAYDLGGEGYPVSESALDSLPAYIRATLERDGVVQILTHYDTAESEFTDISLADEPTSEELIARMALLLGRGLSLHETVDYLVVKELDHYAAEQWASIRGVGVEAVRTNVREAQEQLALS